MSTAHRTVSFADVADTIVVRLEQRFGRTQGDGFVRLVIAPLPEAAPYRAEAGVHVVVHPPQPNTTGGRYDTKVQRDVEVYVVTESLSDVGGRDDSAMLKHLVAEETVVDAMKDLYQPSAATGGAVAIRWKGGAQGQHRLMRVDAGLVVSSLAFEVTYAFPFTTPT